MPVALVRAGTHQLDLDSMTTDYRGRRLRAVASANELLAEACVDPAHQVDVFGLCERVGLWLAFQPLGRLLGAFIPEGVGGVLITTERPVAVQRYTAAHELGHWRLGHAKTQALDSENEILGTTPDNESEHLAQIFAAALLMPPPLVFGTLSRLGVGDDISAVDAYTVARESGVSYEAAVRQLANFELIDYRRLVDLLATPPLEVKTKIGLGRRPVSGNADVWPVDEDWHGHQLSVRIDDEVVLLLPENRSTGYRWVFTGQETQRPQTAEPPPLPRAESFDGLDSSARALSFLDQMKKADRGAPVRKPGSDVVPGDAANPLTPRRNVDLGNGAKVVGDRYFMPRSSVVSEQPHMLDRALFMDSSLSRLSLPDSAAEPPVVGTSGQRALAVRFESPGSVNLRLNYISSYNDAGPAEQYSLTALVEPRRYGISIEQLTSSTEGGPTLGVPPAQVWGSHSEPITDEPLT